MGASKLTNRKIISLLEEKKINFYSSFLSTNMNINITIMII